MIQKIQKLKAKKGFTLVELIVVIAIIGVLAAILVPTMMGFVQKSQITSANNTAATVGKAVKAWLTELDSKNIGMKQGSSNSETIKMGFDEKGTISFTGTTFDKDNWNGGTAPVTNGSAALDPNIYFKSVLSDLKSATVIVYLDAANVTGVAVVPAKGFDSSKFPAKTDFKAGSYASWDNGKEGVLAGGDICGTSPTLVAAAAKP